MPLLNPKIPVIERRSPKSDDRMPGSRHRIRLRLNRQRLLHSDENCGFHTMTVFIIFRRTRAVRQLINKLGGTRELPRRNQIPRVRGILIRRELPFQLRAKFFYFGTDGGAAFAATTG